MTAGETMFSLAISSIFPRWRASSCAIASYISGSVFLMQERSIMFVLSLFFAACISYIITRQTNICKKKRKYSKQAHGFFANHVVAMPFPPSGNAVFHDHLRDRKYARARIRRDSVRCGEIPLFSAQRRRFAPRSYNPSVGLLSSVGTAENETARTLTVRAVSNRLTDFPLKTRA